MIVRAEDAPPLSVDGSEQQVSFDHACESRLACLRLGAATAGDMAATSALSAVVRRLRCDQRRPELFCERLSEVAPLPTARVGGQTTHKKVGKPSHGRLKISHHLIHPQREDAWRVRGLFEESGVCRRSCKVPSCRMELGATEEVHVRHEAQPVRLAHCGEMMPVCLARLDQGGALRFELAHRLGSEPQRLGVLARMCKRACGVGRLDPALGSRVLAVVVVKRDGPRRWVANHVHDQVARGHLCTAGRELGCDPHLDVAGCGAGQVVVERIALVLLRVRSVEPSQGVRHSGC